MTDDTNIDEIVLSRVENGVRWITLNRPDAANSILPVQRNRVIELLEEASGDLNVRSVVIGATGRFFCTGADLRASRGPAPEKPAGAPERIVGEAARVIKSGAQALMSAVLDCEKPVIAAVNGTAAGIGAHLALSADLVIAADTAKFIEVFARRGLVPDGGGAWLLTRSIGRHKTMELLLFAEDLPAAEAEKLGLVNKVVAAGALEATAKEWAERLANGPTKSFTWAKRLVNHALDTDRATLFNEEAWYVELNAGTADSTEGMMAFVERRDPEFKGW